MNFIIYSNIGLIEYLFLNYKFKCDLSINYLKTTSAQYPKCRMNIQEPHSMSYVYIKDISSLLDSIIR